MISEKVKIDNTGHLYLQVSRILEERILRNEIAVGEKLPAIRTLNKDLGVGIGTIKKALAILGSEGYIASRPKHGTIVINSSPARAVDLEKKNEVGVIFGVNSGQDSFFNPYMYMRFGIILMGIEKKLREKNLHISYSTASDELRVSLKEKSLAGFIITGEVTPAILKDAERSGAPFVLIGDVPQEKKQEKSFDVIVDDDFSGINMAAAHLTALGHRNILYFASAGSQQWKAEQLRGYREALNAAGIVNDRNLEVLVSGGPGMEAGYREMLKVLESPRAFTGMICNGDALWNSARLALKEKGVRIPEDLSVVCSGMSQDLTVVSSDDEKTGAAAVERLLERITNPAWKPGRIIIPKKMTERNSTGAA